MEYFYHGTLVSGITEVRAVSKSHDIAESSVVYVTPNRAYSLFYIIDKGINWVTCGVGDNGVVQYKEQFPNQLSVIYSGISGYVYRCAGSPSIKQTKTKDVYSSEIPIPVLDSEYIEDVYDEIIKCERMGLVAVKRYEMLTADEKQDIHEMMLHYIFKNDLLAKSTGKASFIKANFPSAWKQAEDCPESKQQVLEEWTAKLSKHTQ